MAADPFAPLAGASGAAPRRANRDDWVPLLPVPPKAPPPPEAHPKRGKPTASWEYRSPRGELLGLVCRFDRTEGGKEILPLTFCENRGRGRQEWRWKGFPEPRPLYGLDRLTARPQAPVVVCEGEKAADAAGRLLPDRVAVTSPSGSKSAAKTSWIDLRGRAVTIWPDADLPGRDYALAVARLLQGSGASAAIIAPPAEAPEPEKGESIDLLRELVNVRSEGDFRLFIAWLLACFRPRGPYPILVINGEQGSSKSTLARLARMLIDPNKSDIRAEPRDDRDLLISAKNNWAVVLDNMSSVPAWLSDGLCRLSTGGGSSTRELFTDWGETIFDGQRPIIINGIPDLVSRPDLASRAILLTLPAIPEDERKSEEEFKALLNARLPFILGAILDAVSGALRCRSDVKMERKPRMADFAVWIVSAEISGALGWADGSFLDAYNLNQQGVVETVIDGDPVAGAVRAMVGSDDWQGSWQGTATQLLEALGGHASEVVRRSKVWPA
ncbi:MAG: hypothetical protein IT565_12195, partial [Rhodospirillales bacterium]|nr:hypothetical protein [Rhodospirillales bacterium]